MICFHWQFDKSLLLKYTQCVSEVQVWTAEENLFPHDNKTTFTVVQEFNLLKLTQPISPIYSRDNNIISIWSKRQERLLIYEIANNPHDKKVVLK